MTLNGSPPYRRLCERVAKMSVNQLERLGSLSPEDAAWHVRCEMPRSVSTRTS